MTDDTINLGCKKLMWDLDKESLYGNDDLSIYTKKIKITGKNFKTSIPVKKITVQGDVVAEIKI